MGKRVQRPSQAGSPAGRLSLFQLKYSSVINVDRDRVEHILAEILAVSLKNNPKSGVTGMLYYSPNTAGVVQVLEGPQDTVLALFEKIQADPRHSECKLMDTGIVEARLFPDFGMALARTSDDAGVLIEEAMATGFSEHLVRLIYTSRLRADTVDQARDMVRSILQTAVRNNTARQIGGLLCFNPSTMQVQQLLEGPAGAVQELFTTIMADARHTDCTLISQELLLSKEEYVFGSSWGMMQSETTEMQLLNLDGRVKHAFHGRTVAAVMGRRDGEGGALSPAEMQKLIDGAVGGIYSTPTMDRVM